MTNFYGGYGGFNQFGYPFLGGFLGGLLGNVIYPGRYPYFGRPYYPYPPYPFFPYPYQHRRRPYRRFY